MQDRSFRIRVAGKFLTVTVWDREFRVSMRQPSPALPAQLKALHRHRDYEVFLMPHSTLAVHTAEGERHFDDSLTLIPPHLEHFVTLESGAEGYYFYLSSEEGDTAWGRELCSLRLSEDERFYAARIADALDGKSSPEVLPHLWTLLFEELSSRLHPRRALPEQPLLGDGRYVNTIDYFLAQSCFRRITLAEIADELHLCPRQVSRILGREYGCTLPELVNRHRLSVAQRLLRQTELEIGEIARQVGFSHENYFYTLFRKRFGVTPCEYRRGETSGT